ncbi:hypothetical protein QOZ80_5AG0370040 [Eleusine coracana subsp. coracana]|nr:hypothetical protein QOZ80_5AG0370040 [Eleusine coracana subsp. coracana]
MGLIVKMKLDQPLLRVIHGNLKLPPPVFHDTDDSNMHLHLKMILEYQEQNVKILSEARAKGIISPELTPQSVIFDFSVISPQLSDILKKDSVRSFLNLFENNLSRLTWGYIIAAHTFNFIVALEGKARKLFGNQVNPNYMTSFGFFPLHQAAATFSLDMINLLIDYGASANVRTAGSEIIEGLLPLHVAIENACMHKYLEDNLLIDQKHLEHSDLHVDYIYKLIHLLCLPEMRINSCEMDIRVREMVNWMGEALDACVQTHSEVPHHDILQHVSSVLKDHGFIPAGKCIDIADLYCCPYKCETSEDGGMDATVESPDLNVKAKKIVGNEVSRRQDYRMFIPYWRSVLTLRLPVKGYTATRSSSSQKAIWHCSTDVAEDIEVCIIGPTEAHGCFLRDLASLVLSICSVLMYSSFDKVVPLRIALEALGARRQTYGTELPNA